MTNTPPPEIEDRADADQSNPPALLRAPLGPLVIPSLAKIATPVLLSVVIPTFNESKNIANLVGQLAELLDNAFCNAYEIIVVDDDSPDRTWEIAQSLIVKIPSLRVMRRSERGLSTAVIRGWQVARGGILAVMDADLQHPPGVLLALADEMDLGADMAVASRHVEGGGVSDWGLLRRALSRSAQLLGLLLLPGVVGRVSDPMSGYFMVRRSRLEGIPLDPLGYKILIEVLGRSQPRWISEVPYVFRERLDGESKVTGRIYVDYLRHLLRLRLANLPINRFARFAAVGMSGVLIDMGLLFLLSDPSTLGWGLTRSKLIAAQAAMVNNFIWNDVWTFGDISKKQRSLPQRLRRFAKFEVICVGGLVLNTILLNLQFNILGMNRYVANAVAIAAATGWNFWLNLKLGWRAAGTGDQPADPDRHGVASLAGSLQKAPESTGP